jgi:hypothetical protein
MTIDPHQRARFLLEGARLSEIAPRDELWLRTHVAVCVDCARYGEEIEAVVRGLRSFAFDANPALSERIHLAIGARVRKPFQIRWWAAAVVFLVIVAVTFYKRSRDARRDESDAVLMEEIESRVGRVIPVAMEPLIQSHPEVPK